eukprot:1215644-Amorphochlora_amoeboformis.AAC.1
MSDTYVYRHTPNTYARPASQAYISQAYIRYVRIPTYTKYARTYVPGRPRPARTRARAPATRRRGAGLAGVLRTYTY